MVHGKKIWFSVVFLIILFTDSFKQGRSALVEEISSRIEGRCTSLGCRPFRINGGCGCAHRYDSNCLRGCPCILKGCEPKRVGLRCVCTEASAGCAEPTPQPLLAGEMEEGEEGLISLSSDSSDRMDSWGTEESVRLVTHEGHRIETITNTKCINCDLSSAEDTKARDDKLRIGPQR